jgi:hypothetical protein
VKKKQGLSQTKIDGFAASRTAFKEMLREFLQKEGKWYSSESQIYRKEEHPRINT